jgi:hypothetical protein
MVEHEHIDSMAAAALAQHLPQQLHGADQLRDMIVDDIRTALRRHDLGHAKELITPLCHFIGKHKAKLIAVRNRGR